jgi:hypothetical protein
MATLLRWTASDGIEIGNESKSLNIEKTVARLLETVNAHASNIVNI